MTINEAGAQEGASLGINCLCADAMQNSLTGESLKVDRMKAAKRGLIAVCALLGAGEIHAQLISDSFSSQAAGPETASVQSIVGNWEGYLRCGGRGWAVFHDISEDNGRLFTAGIFARTSSNKRAGEVFLVGESIVIDMEDRNAYDYEYVLKDGSLVGFARGEKCTTRLWRVTP